MNIMFITTQLNVIVFFLQFNNTNKHLLSLI